MISEQPQLAIREFGMFLNYLSGWHNEHHEDKISVKRPEHTEEELRVLSHGIDSERDYNRTSSHFFESLTEKTVGDPVYRRYGVLSVMPKFGRLLEKELSERCEIKTYPFGSCERDFIESYELGGQIYVAKTFQGPEEKQVIEKIMGAGIYPLSELWGGILVEMFLGPKALTLKKVRISAEKTGEILAHVCNTLHQCGVVYQDDFARHVFYHPANDKAYLMDFGVSTISTSEEKRYQDIENAIELIEEKHPGDSWKGIDRFYKRLKQKRLDYNYPGAHDSQALSI